MFAHCMRLHYGQAKYVVRQSGVYTVYIHALFAFRSWLSDIFYASFVALFFVWLCVVVSIKLLMHIIFCLLIFLYENGFSLCNSVLYYLERVKYTKKWCFIQFISIVFNPIGDKVCWAYKRWTLEKFEYNENVYGCARGIRS